MSKNTPGRERSTANRPPTEAWRMSKRRPRLGEGRRAPGDRVTKPEFDVVHDGPGFAEDARPGIGFDPMHHRIAATGRQLTILATTDAGPVCTAPCCSTHSARTVEARVAAIVRA
jgi:hypothetical protein